MNNGVTAFEQSLLSHQERPQLLRLFFIFSSSRCPSPGTELWPVAKAGSVQCCLQGCIHVGVGRGRGTHRSSSIGVQWGAKGRHRQPLTKSSPSTLCLLPLGLAHLRSLGLYAGQAVGWLGSVHGPREVEAQVAHLGLVDGIELLILLWREVLLPVLHDTWGKTVEDQCTPQQLWVPQTDGKDGPVVLIG